MTSVFDIHNMAATAQLIIDLMSTGKSKVEVMAKLGITEARFNQILRDPEKKMIREAYEVGKIKEHAFWEAVGKVAVTNRQDEASLGFTLDTSKFKESTYKWITANKLGWKDKVDTTTENVNIESQLPMDELQKRIDQLVKENGYVRSDEL